MHQRLEPLIIGAARSFTGLALPAIVPTKTPLLGCQDPACCKPRKHHPVEFFCDSISRHLPTLPRIQALRETTDDRDAAEALHERQPTVESWTAKQASLYNNSMGSFIAVKSRYLPTVYTGSLRKPTPRFCIGLTSSTSSTYIVEFEHSARLANPAK